MTMTIECYICGLGLDDVEVHDDDWRLSNIDGANVPLCYGCIDKQFEYDSEELANAQADGWYTNDDGEWVNDDPSYGNWYDPQVYQSGV